MSDSEPGKETKAESESLEAEKDISALPVRMIDSKDLFADSEVVLISHSEKLYQLRKTANDGLILTK